MSDAQLPPPDPDEVEGLEESAEDSPAVAGVGPALLAPPVPPPTSGSDDEDGADEG